MKKKYIYTIIVIILLFISVYYYNNIPIPSQPETTEDINKAILDFFSNTYTLDDITKPKWGKDVTTDVTTDVITDITTDVTTPKGDKDK